MHHSSRALLWSILDERRHIGVHKYPLQVLPETEVQETQGALTSMHKVEKQHNKVHLTQIVDSTCSPCAGAVSGPLRGHPQQACCYQRWFDTASSWMLTMQQVVDQRQAEVEVEEGVESRRSPLTSFEELFASSAHNDKCQPCQKNIFCMSVC